MGTNHLEAPKRLQFIEEAIRASDIKHSFIKADRATQEDILSIHSEQLLSIMLRSTGIAKIDITMDTFTNMFTFEAAMTAAGASLQVAKGLGGNHGFAMVRPPGHHATREQSMGFCFFNNVALAATSIMDKYNRIAIIDVDNHYGNGTSDIFADNSELLYLSLHADPETSYPGSGFAENVGNADGYGTTVNIPLPWKLEDGDYLIAMDELMVPIVEQFKPEIILVSLGLDGLKDDPYGSLGLSVNAFHEMGRRIGRLNRRFGKKVGSFLEGGYKYSEIGAATVAFFEGLCDYNGETRVEPKLTHKFEYSLRKIKAIQRNHWFGL